MSRIVIYSVLILVVQGISFGGAAINPEKCQFEEPNQPNYNVVKFFLKYVRQFKSELEKNELQNRNNEIIINELRDQIDDLKRELIKTNIEKNDSLVEMKNNFNELNEKKNELFKCENKCNGLNETLVEENERLSKCEYQFNELNKTLVEKNERLVNWENNFNKLNESFVGQNNELFKQRKDLQMCKTDNEILKANEKRVSDSYTSRIHSINVPDYGSFDVLFDNKTDETDWIVIQQRVDGKENFFRDWNTYVAGFGSFKGDFFLGLEKIHRLTSSTRYQLLIRVEYFNGTMQYAEYNNFKVDGNETNYTLSSVGQYSSDKDGQFRAGNNLEWHEGKQFSTFDNENDFWNKDCAATHHGGWWYNHCTASNLNGEFSVTDGNKYAQMYWADYLPLKSAQMLIRKYQPL